MNNWVQLGSIASFRPLSVYDVILGISWAILKTIAWESLVELTWNDPNAYFIIICS